MKTVVVSARFSPRLLSHLDALCHASLQKRAAIIRLLIARSRLYDLPESWCDLTTEERELLQESR